MIADAYGVFVSASAQASGNGTKAQPFKTMGEALSNAHGKNLYVCAGSYAESVTIDSAVDGAKIFGGFDCGTWAYGASARARVQPTSGVALTVRGVTAGVVLEDLEFDAPAATAAGDNSIAAFIASSKNVALSRVKLVAKDAKAGANASATVSNYDTTLTSENAKIAGHDATNATGGSDQACPNLCVTAPMTLSSGGRGGNGASGADAGTPGGGLAGGPDLSGTSPYDGKGGTGGAVCENGNPGASPSAATGGKGASTHGVLSTSGWATSDGTAGTTGTPGQGGGGGGGGLSPSKGGGGGGACGGCGGTGGGAGKGGGSSLALLSYQSTSVTLTACTLVSGDAGQGGDGGNGQAGQSGGNGGLPSSGGCSGGNGGQGAQGGGGGGGAGGLSLGIGYVGTAPLTDTATAISVSTTVAQGGALGTGGSPAATKGIDGVSQRVLELTGP